MALNNVDLGTAPDNGTGDDIRTGGGKINANFAYLDGVKLEKSTYTGNAQDLEDTILAGDIQTLSDAKVYTDTLAQGIKWKQSVTVATTANIALTGEQSIDGVLTSGNRVLVKDQTNATENGIYISNSGAWTRSLDADTGAELVSATVTVEKGTANKDKNFNCSSDSIVLGTDPIVFNTIANTVSHNAVTGLQGGQLNEYYHLTLEERDSLPKKTAIVNNITDLKAFTALGADSAVEVLGYYAKGDGGGGSFYWDATSTETDNGGTIIKVTAVTTGRWKRRFSGAVNVKWFGAKNYISQTDALNGDSSNIAIDNAISSLGNQGGVILFPGDYFKIDATVNVIRDGVILEGLSGGITTSIIQTVDSDAINVDNPLGGNVPFGFEIRNIWVIGYKNRSLLTEGNFSCLKISDAFLCRIENCYFEHGRYGVFLNNAGDIFIENSFIEDSPHQLTLVGSSSVNVNGVRFMSPNDLGSHSETYAIKVNSSSSKNNFSNISVTAGTGELTKGVAVYGGGNNFNNLSISGGIKNLYLDGVSCKGNSLSNLNLINSTARGLDLFNGCNNNAISNANIEGNEIGFVVSSTIGINNKFSNINTSNNVTEVIISDTAALTIKLINCNFPRATGTTAQRPGAGVGKINGFQYYDTDLGKNIYWAGSVWLETVTETSLKSTSRTYTAFQSMPTPTADTHAATKKYVDDKVILKGVEFSVSTNVDGHTIPFINGDFGLPNLSDYYTQHITAEGSAPLSYTLRGIATAKPAVINIVNSSNSTLTITSDNVNTEIWEKGVRSDSMTVLSNESVSFINDGTWWMVRNRY